MSKSAVERQYRELVEKLPYNNEFTAKYCNRYCGILVVDGKFIKVKGYQKKIPLLWGIDYLTHDIPVFELAKGESYEAWLKYFGHLKRIHYSPSILVCDDNENIKLAGRYMFPKIAIQTCQNHFLERIRKDLNVRTEERYQGFILDLKRELFSEKIMQKTFNKRAYKLYQKYKGQEVEINYLIKIAKYAEELSASSTYRGCPRDTNLMELYNSHLEARLKSIKGFESFSTAKKWLNAYILRRRVNPFTDCSKKFRFLNGKSACSVSLKKQVVLPVLF